MKYRCRLPKAVIAALMASMMVTSSTGSAFAYSVHKPKASETNVAEEEAKQKEIDGQKKEAGILTINEAIRLARANNSSYQTIMDNINNMNDSRDRLAQSSALWMPTGRFVVDPETMGILQGIKQTEAGIKSLKYQEEMLDLSIPFEVLKEFITIKTAEAQLALSEKSYAVSQKQLEEAQLKLQLGMISQSEYDKMQKTLEQTKIGMDQLKLAIEKNYIAFRSFLGVSQEEELVLDELPAEVTPYVMDMDIQTFINRAVTADPTIKEKKDAIETAEFNMNSYTYSSITDTYKSKETALATASRAYEDAKKNKDQAVREAVNNLQANEENAKSLQTVLEKAEDDLAVAKTNLQVGNITQLTYNQAELAVESAKVDILLNQYQYQLLKYMLENPALIQGAQ